MWPMVLKGIGSIAVPMLIGFVGRETAKTLSKKDSRSDGAESLAELLAGALRRGVKRVR
jgi:hypothetical protein